jgi:hypothetical protein
MIILQTLNLLDQVVTLSHSKLVCLIKSVNLQIVCSVPVSHVVKVLGNLASLPVKSIILLSETSQLNSKSCVLDLSGLCLIFSPTELYHLFLILLAPLI